MIEGFAREIPEADMLAALQFGHQMIREIIGLQRELYEKVQPKKNEFVAPPDDGLAGRLAERFYNDLKGAKQTSGKQARNEAVKAVKERALA